MKRSTPFRPPAQAGAELSALQSAFLAALVDRVPRGGSVILPTRSADAAEVGRVLVALERTRGSDDGGRR
jgi:hypothetical protein